MSVSIEKFQNHPDVVKKEQEYRQFLPFLEKAVRTLQNILDDINREYKAECGADFFITREVRLKSWKSVRYKLWEELRDKPATRIGRQDVETAYNSIRDIAGGRIEVTYFDEVQDRAGHLIRYSSDRNFKTDLEKQGIKDKIYLDDDNEGYRAYHLFIQCPLKDDKGKQRKIVFEIQIRSSFQHVWAKLMHPLVYSRLRGQDCGIPNDVKNDMIALSAQIFAADRALMSLRERVKRY